MIISFRFHDRLHNPRFTASVRLRWIICKSLGLREIFLSVTDKLMPVRPTVNNTNKHTTESSLASSRRRHTSPPVPPPGELDETYASSLIRVYSPIIWKPHVGHKTKVHCSSNCRQNRATATGNMYRNIGEIGAVCLEICL